MRYQIWLVRFNKRAFFFANLLKFWQLNLRDCNLHEYIVLFLVSRRNIRTAALVGTIKFTRFFFSHCAWKYLKLGEKSFFYSWFFFLSFCQSMCMSVFSGANRHRNIILVLKCVRISNAKKSLNFELPSLINFGSKIPKISFLNDFIAILSRCDDKSISKQTSIFQFIKLTWLFILKSLIVCYKSNKY